MLAPLFFWFRWINIVLLLFSLTWHLCCSNEGAGELVDELLAGSDQKQVRDLQASDNNGNDSGLYVYSKMATIVPDPLLSDVADDTKEEYKTKFGRWRFWDGDENLRPSQTDYCGRYPHRDIAGEFFPQDAWQTDAVFVNHLLNDGEKLCERAMEAIYTDYGLEKSDSAEALLQRSQMFPISHVDLAQTTVPPEIDDSIRKGGWTTPRSQLGLVRRLLHALHSNDEFVVVLGGDAVAAGHANHFQQSYLMQFHRILSPIFARMGVKLVTRNLAMGHGLGTFQSALGFSSLFGQDIDILIWDSTMTENHVKYIDLFFRQGILSGQGKIPFLMIGPNANTIDGFYQLLQFFHNEANVDVAQLGNAMKSVPITQSSEQALTLPLGFQFLACSEDSDSLRALCNQKKHCTHCWIERKDISKDLFPQLVNDNDVNFNGASSSQRWWYPGWRNHQLLGRSLAHFILNAMEDAISEWSAGTMGGPPLDDHQWHVTPFYDTMRANINASFMAQSAQQPCYQLASEFLLPPRICRVPMKGATQNTPRPNATSITSLIDYLSSDDPLVPKNPRKVLYYGQDVHNECLDSGAINVVQIVSLRRMLRQSFGSQSRDGNGGNDDLDYMPQFIQQIHKDRIARQQQITPYQDSTQQQRTGRIMGDSDANIKLGSGWVISDEKPGQCDGQYLSICGRDSLDSCPLLGYHDSQGEILGNDKSGWLVLNLRNVKEGIVIIQCSFYDSPHPLLSNGQNRYLRQSERQLDAVLPDGTAFALEFAIDGDVTSWGKKDLLEHGRALHNKSNKIILTLLDKPNFAETNVNVQLAIRVRGCGGSLCTFALSHVYWA